MFRGDLHVRRARRGDADANAGEHNLMDVGDFDQHRLF